MYCIAIKKKHTYKLVRQKKILKINSYIFDQLICNRGAKNTEWRKNSIFYSVCTTDYPHEE